MRPLIVGAILLGGCASQGVYLPDETLVLSQVVSVVTPEQVAADASGQDGSGGTLRQLVGKQYTAEQIAAGRVVVVRDGIYWNNTASGIKRDMLRTALVPEGMAVAPGNVFEGAIGGQGRPYTIRRIRAENLDDGGCRFLELPTSELRELMGGISLAGSRGAATLYCKGIENQGWQRPRTYWHKLPGAVASPAPPPGGLSIIPGEPPEVVAYPILAHLILARNGSLFGLGPALPVWIDGAKVADLSPGSCKLLLLEPGDYVVSAGTAAPSDLWGLSKLELRLSVKPSDRVVAEYVVDPPIKSTYQGFGPTPIERMRAESYRFTQRPAKNSETCPGPAEPPVVRQSAAASGAQP